MNFLNLIEQIFSNFPLVSAITAGLFSQLFKFIFESIKRRKIEFVVFLSPGGTISAHTASVTSLTFALGIKYGFSSGIFALSSVFLGLVIFDAIVIRGEASKHAQILNRLLRESFQKRKIDGDTLKAVLGHTPLEAFLGILVGICVPLILKGFF